ncbi:MAG: threonine synthase [Anaerolineae bacterium]
MNFYCAVCSHRETWPTMRWRCPCGQPFFVENVPRFRPAAIRPQEPGIWRYRELLPPMPPHAEPVSMGEGNTPLLLEEWDGLRVGFKLEFLSPTGSFKDRGSSLLVSFLHAWGIHDVVDDSSGNAGASLAAYGARAGLQVRIFAPAHTSAAKRAQIRVYGAEFIPVEGPRSRATEAALEAVRAGAYYASHAYHPMFLEGVVTLGYELFEQLGRQMPDNLLFPVGHGSLIASTYIAVRRMQEAGILHAMPRFFAVQAQACAPVFAAWQNGWEETQETQSSHTVAEGISVARPAWGRCVLKAVRESGGAVLTVSDEEILTAREALARRGLYVEPTAAVPFAALMRLRQRFHAQELTVLPLTGHGLKAS